MIAVPWTYEQRPDTRVTNVRLAVWLFLASEAMFFGSLFSAYVLVRTGAETWPDASLLRLDRVVIPTILLLIAVWCSRTRMELTTLAGSAFVAIKLADFIGMLRGDQHPASSMLLACWFVLAGLHWLHVAGGVVATVWVRQSKRTIPAAHFSERAHAIWLYWCFVDVVWIAILVAFI